MKNRKLVRKLRRYLRIGLVILVISSLLGLVVPTRAGNLNHAVQDGDRGERQGFRMGYPKDAFWHNGPNDGSNPCDAMTHNGRGRVLDIKEMFGAKGDGVTDDTEAFVAAYDCVMGKSLFDPTERHSIDKVANIIYLPKGIYLVSNTVIYSFKRIDRPNGQESLHAIRFVGESRAHTKIKLKDNAPGFEDPENPKSVLSFGKANFNEIQNAVASNFVRNLTIDTGKGNPGAVGIKFQSANVAGIVNVTLIGDSGRYGIHFPLGASQGYYKDITVRGFDIGIYAQSNWWASHLTYEYISLLKQREVGFRIDQASASLRKVFSSNRVPVISFESPDSQLAVIDSHFVGIDAREKYAFDFTQGHLFARNLRAFGYAGFLTERADINPPPNNPSELIEYVSDLGWPKRGLCSKKDCQMSLNLDIEDAPGVPYLPRIYDEATTYAPPEQWVSVNSFGAQGNASDDYEEIFNGFGGYTQYSIEHDDSAAIQAAFDSGASTVYFLPGRYLINETITIPSSVERIDLMFSGFKWGDMLGPNKPAFVIQGDREDKPLVVEDMYNIFLWDRNSHPDRTPDPGSDHTWFQHDSQRTAVFRYSVTFRCPLYANTVSGGKVFFDNSFAGNRVVGLGIPNLRFSGQQVWARDLNPEMSSGLGDTVVVNDGSHLWVLGYKVEIVGQGQAVAMRNQNGGRLEVLGGISNQRRSNDSVPNYINQDAYASIHFRRVGNVTIPNLIQSIREDKVKIFPESAAISGPSEQAIVPLNVDYPVGSVWACFTVDQTNTELPLTVGFDASCSSGSNFTWDFGDGNDSSDEITSHVYSTPGEYTVTLSAQDGAQTDSETRPVQVVERIISTHSTSSRLAGGS